MKPAAVARPCRVAPVRELRRTHGAVLGVGDVLAPGGALAFVVDLEHGEVRHEAGGLGPVPVIFAGFKEDAVTGSDDLNGAAAPLR